MKPANIFLTVTAVQTDAVNSKTQFAETKGKKIAYRSIGNGDTIIFVNRFRGTLDTWDPLFLDSLAENFNVVTFDYTGIGSSSGTLPTDIVDVATDVKDLAEFLELKSITVLGWSYGGLVAQVATLQYPELITHSILVGTNPPGHNEIPLEQAFLDCALKPINDFDDEVILFFEPNSEASVKAAKLSHDRIAKRIDVSKIPSTMDVFQLYFAGGAGLREDNLKFRDQLKATTTPILVICGDHDISFAVENWFALLRELPTAQIIVFPHTGHAPQHQFPELSAKYITNFIQLTTK
ncbi:alpha/beta fold hydrolase [Flavobacterium taihuense]|uniref:Alpha/beta hydrolase n=1 Tax=Flavobacterium taihuense TaxID=2857508 RepID=A0ABS6XYZ7_9FLAO|nr:alpha/beta hydrolase [Flavobacterium taihuense]MBW4361597.1 alpha/beta hydrolase [Flavobacterium taihuense]